MVHTFATTCVKRQLLCITWHFLIFWVMLHLMLSCEKLNSIVNSDVRLIDQVKFSDMWVSCFHVPLFRWTDFQGIDFMYLSFYWNTWLVFKESSRLTKEFRIWQLSIKCSITQKIKKCQAIHNICLFTHVAAKECTKLMQRQNV